MTVKPLYSNILQDFARPLLNAKDTDEIFMQKMKIIEIIWNYSIAKKFRMPVFDVLDKIISTQNKLSPPMKEVFDSFLELKKTDFDQYNNYITKIELRVKTGGDKTLYVESVSQFENNSKVK